MSKLFDKIFRGPYWAPLLAAALLAVLGFALRFGFALEAETYSKLASQPLPAPVAIDRFHPRRDDAGPQEAVLRVQILTHDQIALGPASEGDGAANTFIPFTVPPGSAGEGRVLGGMILSKQARDAFVQWAVTEAHPRLANDGVEMTLAGLVEAPPHETALRDALAAHGVDLPADPVILTPYMGRRAAVLGARVDYVADNPVTRLVFFAALALALFGLNRFAVLRRPRAAEPEPLRDEAIRDTPFARLAPVPAETTVSAAALVGPEVAQSATRAAQRARALTEPKPRKPLLPAWLRRLPRVTALWAMTAVLGWLLWQAFPVVLGAEVFVAGLLVVPGALLLRALWPRVRGWAGARLRRLRPGSRHAVLRSRTEALKREAQRMQEGRGSARRALPARISGGRA